MPSSYNFLPLKRKHHVKHHANDAAAHRVHVPGLLAGRPDRG